MLKLNLQRKIIDHNQAALIFDKTAFTAFQTVDDASGIEPTDMIAKAPVDLLGPVMVTGSEDESVFGTVS